MNAKSAITKFPENGSRAKVPTRPSQRGISIHVFGVFGHPCVKKKLDALLSAKGGGAVERGLGFRPDIAHEAVRFHGWFGHTIGICPRREQNLDDLGMGRTFGFAECGVQRSFSGIRQRTIHIRAIFNEELVQAPVPMKGRAIEIEVFSQRLE